ncbi:MAG: protein kinase [Chloroflexaceae bacterium]|nr:protein kinase [Chloroflexaceae bacterium]
MVLPPHTLVHNRYRIVRPIGQGGMGAVYEAIDEHLSYTVALKQTLTGGTQLDKAFEREARILARLRHPSLVRVTDHFVDSHGQFLVMDFIPGDDLGALMTHRGSPFPVETVLNWADQVLQALDYLHHQTPPVVHRDIKPQNLKLTTGGQIVLLDFGLAKGSTTLQSAATTASSIFGYTPQYAPLEQIQGSGTEPRSDLYALAATVYHLLAGSPPEHVLSRTAAMMNHQPDPLRPLHEVNPQVPPAVSQVVQQALSLQIDRRPASAAQMQASLQAALYETTVEATRQVVVVQPASPNPPTSVVPQESPPPPAGRVAHSYSYTGTTIGPPPAGGRETPHETPHEPSLPPWVWLAAGAGGVAVLAVLVAALVLVLVAHGNGKGDDQDGEVASSGEALPSTPAAQAESPTLPPTLTPQPSPTLPPSLTPQPSLPHRCLPTSHRRKQETYVLRRRWSK